VNPPASRKRRANHDFGLRAETFAAIWLRLKLYKILARRYRVNGGEIDIIARRGDDIVFVEVKARGRMDDALIAINAAKAAAPRYRRGALAGGEPLGGPIYAARRRRVRRPSPPAAPCDRRDGAADRVTAPRLDRTGGRGKKARSRPPSRRATSRDSDMNKPATDIETLKGRRRCSPAIGETIRQHPCTGTRRSTPARASLASAFLPRKLPEGALEDHHSGRAIGFDLIEPTSLERRRDRGSRAQEPPGRSRRRPTAYPRLRRVSGLALPISPDSTISPSSTAARPARCPMSNCS